MEFTKYTERRVEPEAAQFTDPGQASEIVEMFNGNHFSLVWDTCDLIALEFDGYDGGTSNAKRFVVRYRDYIVKGEDRNYGHIGYSVVPRREFEEKFMIRG